MTVSTTWIMKYTELWNINVHELWDMFFCVAQFHYGEDGLDILKTCFLTKQQFPFLISNNTAVMTKSLLTEVKSKMDTQKSKQLQEKVIERLCYLTTELNFFYPLIYLIHDMLIFRNYGILCICAIYVLFYWLQKQRLVLLYLILKWKLVRLLCKIGACRKYLWLSSKHVSL